MTTAFWQTACCSYARGADRLCSAVLGFAGRSDVVHFAERSAIAVRSAIVCLAGRSAIVWFVERSAIVWLAGVPLLLYYYLRRGIRVEFKAK